MTPGSPPSVPPAAHPIHDDVLDFIAAPHARGFEALALRVFAHQFEQIAAYRQVCERQGRTPATVYDWRQIPPVPAQAFKHVELWGAPPQRVFLSSGTTHGQETRSRHGMPDLRLYRAAALAGMQSMLFPDVPVVRILSLIPAAHEQPHSSLAQMAAWAIEAFGDDGSAGFAGGEQFDFAGLVEGLRGSERGGYPVALLTTTGAMIRFLDYCRDHDLTFRLPHSSRLMDTGGGKGAPRVLSRKGFLQAVWNGFAIPGYFVVNEYGMSELSSQYYDNVICDRHHGRATHRAKVGPPWLRPRVLDPLTLQDMPAGETGVLCHVDLANTCTALAVLTEDLGRFTQDGFEVLGRVSGAEARGCSLALAHYCETTGT